jgi:hypothetical protein
MFCGSWLPRPVNSPFPLTENVTVIMYMYELGGPLCHLDWRKSSWGRYGTPSNTAECLGQGAETDVTAYTPYIAPPLLFRVDLGSL